MKKIKIENLILKRSLASLDLETTGTDTNNDRIVEIGIHKISPSGKQRSYHSMVNPGMKIHPEASKVNGISDEDVAEAPKFSEIADKILQFLKGCDLAGFNILGFDLPMLNAELSRLGKSLPLTGVRVIDSKDIYHRFEPRTLSAAVQFYCGKSHEGAHSARSDAKANLEVLDAMLNKYTELPRSVKTLFNHLKEENTVDLCGKFSREGEMIVFNFGKHAGKSLEEVANIEADYLQWMLKGDFLEDVKDLVREVLANKVVNGKNLLGFRPEKV